MEEIPKRVSMDDREHAKDAPPRFDDWFNHGSSRTEYPHALSRCDTLARVPHRAT
eukprot:COSAG01_NODE_16_length_40091_cov_15.728646_29_plen_55_part_00